MFWGFKFCFQMFWNDFTKLNVLCVSCVTCKQFCCVTNFLVPTVAYCSLMLLVGNWRRCSPGPNRVPDHHWFKWSAVHLLWTHEDMCMWQYDRSCCYACHDVLRVRCCYSQGIGEHVQLPWCMCWPHWQETESPTECSAQDEHPSFLNLCWTFAIKFIDKL